MATIKGITIEIDGNTTGLKKSLEGVDKSIRDVNAELKQVNSLLKMDPGNTDLLAQKQELLAKAVADTTGKLNQLKEAQRQASEQLAKGEISDEQYRALSREIIKTEQSLNGFNAELKNTDNTTKKIDFKAVGASMSDIGKKAGEVAANVAKMAGALTAALGAAVGLVAKKLFDGAVAAGEFADELLATASKANISAETLQQWRYAAEFIDTDVETMTSSMTKMTRTLGSNEEAFKSLGITTRDSAGNLKSQEEIFYDSIDALNGIENATQRDIMAQKLFGKSAAELNPLIKAGGDELRRLGEEAIASGAVISGPVLEQFASFDDTIQGLKMQFGALTKNLIAGFMPAIQGLIAPLGDAMGQINVILSDGLQEGDVGKITEVVSNTVNTIATTISEMLPKLVEFIVPVITGLIDTLVQILPTLLPVLLEGVFQLIMGLVNSITSNIAPLIGMVKTLLTMIGEFIANNIGTILQAGIEILFALIDGIVGAIPTLIPTIIQVVLSLVEMLIDNIDKIIETGIEIIIALIEGIVNAIPMLVEKMPMIIEKIITALINLSPQLLQAAIQIIVALAQGLVKSIPTLLKYIPDVIVAIVNGLKNGVSSVRDIGLNMVEGLWEGIKGSFEWIKSKIKGWVGDVMKFIKKLFGITSPSKVMKKEVGLNLGLGVAAGIEDSLGAVNNAMGKLNNEVTASVNPIINPTANSNPLILQIENFINERGTDIQTLMEEAEFLRRNAALAGGVK